ncbi:MAG: hypothetical protein FWD90_11400 [Defluviitaleaceae bacterium]|nr:hypothetical protein [Defluviitaleaceae bacterium]
MFNDEFAIFKHLDIGADIAGSVLGGLLGQIPIFGGALGTLTVREIQNDPVLNRRSWQGLTTISINTTYIKVEECGQRATLLLDWHMYANFSAFRNSHILNLTGISLADETFDEYMTLEATMQKQPNGAWLFTTIGI